MTHKGPRKFGLLVYPGFEALDVFGPLEALNVISRPEFDWIVPLGEPVRYIQDITLSVIAETTDPVSPAWNQGIGSALGQQILPKYTIHDAPELDVLIIPGGLGSDVLSEGVINWVKEVCPTLQYLITVCTGAHIAAMAGCLDGLRATTNKQAWRDLEDPNNKWAQKTYWVAKARWVQSSEKIWTTSGVSAGTDGFIAWITAVYGSEISRLACKWMEYREDEDPSNDPWSKGLHDVPPKM